MDEVQGADVACGDARACFPHHRVVAVDEGNRGDQPARVGQCGQRLRVVQRGCQRLLADHVLAGPQCSFGHGPMQVVGRADVHDLHLRVGHHLLDIAIAARDTPRLRYLGGALRGRGGHATELGTGQQGGATMHGRDHAGTDDGDSRLGHRLQSSGRGRCGRNHRPVAEQQQEGDQHDECDAGREQPDLLPVGPCGGGVVLHHRAGQEGADQHAHAIGGQGDEALRTAACVGAGMGIGVDLAAASRSPAPTGRWP
ncbi:hypothetical protein G6F63_013803 [Rhizopus arrhizus]|nr:hypothetical protein G6F63_013803 [Rhizopus arrhizus]